MAPLDTATPNLSVATHGQTPAKPSPAKLDDVRCPPMSHQNSSSYGHEMYPQQFVRLIGCHDAPAPALRKRQDEKLH
ncbi:hypothetical protein JIR23_30615 [Bradyrhizobium diazoefficiens]|nr:hypothetical protein [Bradyrhizobium diazoefficiens]QQN63803.1 hypothetical protein JIR23_30615 [Bradyrhizobium diazoefficiens]